MGALVFDVTNKTRTAGVRGHTNAQANRLCDEDRAVHDWYRFVLSFPPHLVRDYIRRFGLDSQDRVLDPFCGTGTTLVECRKQGIPSVGIEANPVAWFASRVKVDWTPDPDGLAAHAGKVAELACSALRRDGIDERPPLWRSDSRPTGTLRSLPEESRRLLLANSISPLPLHKVLTLVDCLNQSRDDRYNAHELLALAKAVVFSISNLNFGPEVGVGPIKEDAVVVQTWLDEVCAMTEDLRLIQPPSDVPAEARRADSRQMLDTLPPHSVTAVITSPPYPNEKDYTRTTRLESVLLGFIRTKSDLVALKHMLVRSNTRNVYKGDDDDRWVQSHKQIQEIASAIEKRRIELGKTSGFERMYARVTRLYFGGMARHLADLRTLLRPGAHLAYVVGDQASYLRIMIRTGQILSDIARSLGYQVEGLDLFRTRLATATKEQLREEVLVLRWPG